MSFVLSISSLFETTGENRVVRVSSGGSLAYDYEGLSSLSISFPDSELPSLYNRSYAVDVRISRSQNENKKKGKEEEKNVIIMESKRDIEVDRSGMFMVPRGERGIFLIFLLYALLRDKQLGDGIFLRNT